MKKLTLLPLLLLFLNFGCSSSDDTTTDNLAAKEMFNVSYGADPEQTMDVYLPAGRSDEDTPVIILLHGGFWMAGSKEDMNVVVPEIKQRFPDHAIVNINYRLATNVDPAYPKQINDIDAVMNELKSGNYHVSDDYALIGFSAGAHLSMLYGYAFNTENDVKAVCNIVGPADFTDPAYADFEMYDYLALYVTGSSAPSAEMIEAVNPVAHITAQAPPTISFYGGMDPLIPPSQGPRLTDALDAAGVYNEYNFYPNGGHGDWDAQTMDEVFDKVTVFLETHLEVTE